MCMYECYTRNANLKEIDTKKYFLDIMECVFKLNVSVLVGRLTADADADAGAVTAQ